MAGISITSTASSFFNKLRGKSNPYEKAYRTQSNFLSTNHTTSPQPNVLSDRDLLAEARQAAGRDPVTGRRREDLAGQTCIQQMPAPHVPGQKAVDQRAAYLSWAAQRPQEREQPYRSYSEFVQEMIGEGDGRRHAAGSMTSYYAPERRVKEYYAEGVRY